MAAKQSVGRHKVWEVYLLVPWTFLSLTCLLPLSSVYNLPVWSWLPGSSFVFFFVLLKAAAQKSIAEVGQELEGLVERLVDIVGSLQSRTHLPESGADDEGSPPGLVGAARRGKSMLGGTGDSAQLEQPSGTCLEVEGCSTSSYVIIFLWSDVFERKRGMLEVRQGSVRWAMPHPQPCT